MIAKICPFCQKIFDRDLLKDHIGFEHFGSETGLSQNDDGDKKSTSESDLKIYENIAHPKVKFDCDKCDKQFISEHSFNLHQKVGFMNY